MEAFIVINMTEGTVHIKGPSYPDVKLRKNQEYLFATPQEFFAFKPKLDVLVAAKLVMVKTITEKQAAKSSTEAMEKRRDSYKNDHITASPAEQMFADRAIDISTAQEAKIAAMSETPTETPAVDLNAVKAEIATLKAEFKTCQDKVRKEAIRAKVKELQAKL